jgi:hypothetical protein
MFVNIEHLKLYLWWVCSLGKPLEKLEVLAKAKHILTYICLTETCPHVNEKTYMKVHISFIHISLRLKKTPNVHQKR